MGRLLARNFSGPSIKFDGSATKIVSTNVLDFTGSGTNRNLTFALWHYCVETVSPSRRFIGGPVGQFYCGRNSSNIYFCGVNGVGTNSSAKVPVGKWSFFAVTVSGSEYRHYINGNLVAVNTQANTATTAAAMEIGKDAAGNYANDYIAEPAIFNRALTAEEIRAIYEQGPVAYPKDGSCVLDYRFKEGAINGATIIDSSGKGNHGILTLGTGRIDPYNIPVPNRVVIPGNMSLVAVESTGVTAISVLDATLKNALGEKGVYVGSTADAVTVGGWVRRKIAGGSSNRLFAKGSYGGGVGIYHDILTTGQIQGSVTGAVSTVAAFCSKNSPVISAFQCVVASSKTGLANTGSAKFYNNGNLSQANSGITITSAPANDSFNVLGGTGGGKFVIALPFMANRTLTDEEIYNIYSKAVFPADVLFWHGADSTGTKVMCHKGSYGNRPAEVVACDATLGSGNYFTDDVPWR